MGTGIGGAGPLSRPCQLPGDATCAIDLARAAASGLTSGASSVLASCKPLVTDARALASPAPAPPPSPKSTRPAFALPREPGPVNFPLAFAAFSLMARGTKPYLSMPNFVNIHASSTPPIPFRTTSSPSIAHPVPQRHYTPTLRFPLDLPQTAR
jgi:hypothetical protein